MKLTSLIALVLVVICLMTDYVLNYWYGYYEVSLRPIVWSVILELTEFILFPIILFPVLLIICIISLFKKKHRLWTTAMLVGFLALMGLILERAIPHPRILVMYGMRERIMRDYSLDDLRHLARDVDQLPHSPNDPPGRDKGFMSEELDKTGLKGKYPFLSWGKTHSFEGPSYIAETDGVVDVRWGGIPSGHWGFSVSVNGKRAEPEPGTKILRVSDDIFFAIEGS
jgi:hypothetical protein